jgi:hypothetical protein
MDFGEGSQVQPTASDDVDMHEGDNFEQMPPFDEADGDEGHVEAVRQAMTEYRYVTISLEGFHTTYLQCRFRKHKDSRTHRDRLTQLHANWAPFMMELADAYQEWKALESADPSASPSDIIVQDSVDVDMPGSCPSTSPSSDAPDQTDHSFDFSIDTIDLYTLQRTHTIRRTAQMKTAVALMSQGFLSNVPLCPSIALSLKTLELYRRLRLRKPSFSVEAFAKVVCDLYMVSRDP